jgi:hypothetical protein
MAGPDPRLSVDVNLDIAERFDSQGNALLPADAWFAIVWMWRYPIKEHLLSGLPLPIP